MYVVIEKASKSPEKISDLFEKVLYVLQMVLHPIPGPITSSTTNDYATLNLVIYLVIHLGHTPP